MVVESAPQICEGLNLNSTFSTITRIIVANMIQPKVDQGKVDQIEVYQITCHFKYAGVHIRNYLNEDTEEGCLDHPKYIYPPSKELFSSLCSENFTLIVSLSY